MDAILNKLYDQLYTPPPQTETEQEIDDCHRKLVERLEKPERRLVLRIMGELFCCCQDRRRKEAETEADIPLCRDNK